LSSSRHAATTTAPRRLVFAVVGEDDAPLCLMDLGSGQASTGQNCSGIDSEAASGPAPEAPARASAALASLPPPSPAPTPTTSQGGGSWSDQLALHAALDLVDERRAGPGGDPANRGEPLLRDLDPGHGALVRPDAGSPRVTGWLCPSGAALLLLHDLAPPVRDSEPASALRAAASRLGASTGVGAGSVTPGTPLRPGLFSSLAAAEDALRPFFADVANLYLRAQLSPFHSARHALGRGFESRVAAAARRHGLGVAHA